MPSYPTPQLPPLSGLVKALPGRTHLFKNLIVIKGLLIPIIPYDDLDSLVDLEEPPNVGGGGSHPAHGARQRELRLVGRQGSIVGRHHGKLLRALQPTERHNLVSG